MPAYWKDDKNRKEWREDIIAGIFAFILVGILILFFLLA